MDTEVIAAIIAALVALITSIFSLIFQFLRLKHERINLLEQLDLFKKQIINDRAHHADEMELKWKEYKSKFFPDKQIIAYIQTIPEPTTTQLDNTRILRINGPYIVGPPIDDPIHFYGRKSEVDKIFEML